MANEASGVPRWLPILIVAGIALTIVMIAVISLSVISVFNQVRRTPLHICAIAMVERSPLAAHITGTPQQERGLGSFSNTYSGGVATARETFTLGGPKADITVRAEGRQSTAGSHLTVRIASNGSTHAIYSGPLDCPELHAPSP
jgi:hypothetical protein